MRCAAKSSRRSYSAPSPNLDRAQAIFDDFARFWDAEPEPAERRKLLLSLFAQIWAKDNRIVAVKPNPAFADYFTAASEVRATHPKADADDEATNTGATGVCPRVRPRTMWRSGPRLRGWSDLRTSLQRAPGTSDRSSRHAAAWAKTEAARQRPVGSIDL
jgi:hypothetical protein